MENKEKIFKVKNIGILNFLKRVFSVIFFIPLIILPIYLGGYYFIFIYIIILLLIIDEILNIYLKSKYKIYPFLYILVTIFTFYSFIFLLLNSNDKEPFIFIIFSIWIFDTFSYLGGSILKGKKLFPKISKGKTFTGLISGFIFLFIFYLLVNSYLDYFNEVKFIDIFIIGLLAFIGDIIVSLLKRSVSLKDTGRLIPGHGGILDRMDSFIFVFFIIGITKSFFI